MQMADFGFVKKVLPGERTSTLCGTPEYLAPEVVKGEGHWQAADWWVVVLYLKPLICLTCYPCYRHGDMPMLSGCRAASRRFLVLLCAATWGNTSTMNHMCHRHGRCTPLCLFT
jgi:serine/threonine protein kinase